MNGGGPQEEQLRIELAACYRLFDYLGWCEAIDHHITLRLPGPDPRVLTKAPGLAARGMRRAWLA